MLRFSGVGPEMLQLNKNWVLKILDEAFTAFFSVVSK